MFLKKKFGLAVLFLCIIGIFQGSNRISAYAEDQVEDEVDEAVVDTVGDVVADDAANEEKADGSTGSNDADTVIIFTNPPGNGKELPAGKMVEFVVGFKNAGERDFVIDALFCSLRYPMDYSYYIQNFSSLVSERTIKPKQEATLLYSFTPAEAFAGRPLGLVVSLAYHHADGLDYEEAVFNQTVTITEVDEGFDGETFFLYVFLLAFAILLLLGGHHLLSSYGRGKGESGKKPAVETGTNIKDGIDYDWIPKELLNNYNGSPRQSPRNRDKKSKQSPKSRK